MIIGHEVTNVALTPNKMEVIHYGGRQHADIVNYGPGDVYISWRKDAVIGDAQCLLLKEGQAYEIRTFLSWKNLSLISSAAAKVQVVVL